MSIIPVSKSSTLDVARIVEFFLAQSGLGLLVAVVFGYAISTVYSDLKVQNGLQTELIREQVRESRAVSDSLVTMASRLARQEEILSRLENDR